MLPPMMMPAMATTTPTSDRSLPPSLPPLPCRSACASCSSVTLFFCSAMLFSLFRRAMQRVTLRQQIQQPAHARQRGREPLPYVPQIQLLRHARKHIPGVQR